MIKPAVHEIAFSEDTESLFARFRHLDGAVWLDSGKPRSLQGRFDIISALPEITLQSNHGTTRIERTAGTSREVNSDPFTTAWEIIVEQGLAGDEYSHIPFCGGVIGYFSYDLGEHRYSITRDHANRSPTSHLGWYGWGIITNHQSSKAWLVIHPRCHPETVARVKEILNNPAMTNSDGVTPAPFKLESTFCQGITKDQYLADLKKVMQYIRSGDCYQTNYALRHTATYSGDTWQAYKHLRRISPSPYSAYLPWTDRNILCFSPERFLKVSVGKVETKPIKGTLPRGATLEQDQENAVQLLNSRKDRAENLMIVDLLRNDLGINCATGSVRVPKLFALESFANVHHLVSTITGELAQGRTPLDLLRDAFPGGSITGAPKKRAMEIIAELEHIPRGIYCGSIGYISANGRMDTNIAIRTLEARQGELTCWGGGGIVADSVPEQEFAEAMHKVGNLLHALEKMG